MSKIFLFLLLLAPMGLKAQSIYRTSGGELIFSRTLNNAPVPNSSSRVRMSAFLNYSTNYHYNITDFLGVYSGISLANIGIIYTQEDTTFKKRAYTIGIPLAIKFGKLPSDHYLFIGGEIEFPIFYKQKKIYDDIKRKYSSLFDKRMNSILPSVYAGIQFPDGLSFKLKVYLTDFFNEDFEGKDFGFFTSYRNVESKIFLISLSYNLKQNKIKKIVKRDNNRYANLNIQGTPF